MPDSSNVIQKGTSCAWGAGDVSSPVQNGIVVSASVDAQCQTDYLEDENGARIGIVIYDEIWSGTVTVVCKAGATKPENGTSLTVDGMQLYVTGCRVEWQHKGKKQMVVAVEGGKNVAGA